MDEDLTKFVNSGSVDAGLRKLSEARSVLRGVDSDSDVEELIKVARKVADLASCAGMEFYYVKAGRKKA